MGGIAPRRLDPPRSILDGAPQNVTVTRTAPAEIQDFRLHDTRHTFASRLAMEGVDILAIKELSGWKTLSMAGATPTSRLDISGRRSSGW